MTTDGREDLVRRVAAHCESDGWPEGAAAVLALQAENERLRAALAEIVKFGEDNCNSETMLDSLLVARAALDGKP
jgi:hypothetical protein